MKIINSLFVCLFLAIPIVKINSQLSDNIPIDRLRLLNEQIISLEELNSIKNSSDLRILLCFMCGGESNDVEIFFSQLSSRFSIYGDSSFVINTFIGRSNRKVILEIFVFFFRMKSFLLFE